MWKPIPVEAALSLPLLVVAEEQLGSVLILPLSEILLAVLLLRGLKLPMTAASVMTSIPTEN
jgi:hypothetical protein